MGKDPNLYNDQCTFLELLYNDQCTFLELLLRLGIKLLLTKML